MTQIYSIYSSSATAANTLARSIVAAVFPVVTGSIINATGTKWGRQSTSSLCTIPSLTVFVLLRPSISVHFYISIHRNASDSADLHPVRQGGSCPLTLRTSGPRGDSADEHSA